MGEIPLGFITTALVAGLLISLLFVGVGYWFADLNEHSGTNIISNLTVSEQVAETEEVVEKITKATNATSEGAGGVALGLALLSGGIASVKLFPLALDIGISVFGVTITGIGFAGPMGWATAVLVMVFFTVGIMVIAAILLNRQGGL